jgi:hypothetical protein
MNGLFVLIGLIFAVGAWLYVYPSVQQWWERLRRRGQRR